MEDEDEIKHSIEPPSMADQCGTVFTDVQSFENVEESKFEQFHEEGRSEEGGANVEVEKMEENESVGDGGMNMDTLEVKLEDSKMEEKTSMGMEEGRNEENVEGLMLDDSKVEGVRLGMVDEGQNGENVEESKLEDLKMEEKVIVGDDGVDIEDENVEGSKLEDAKMEVEAGLVNEAGDERSLEDNVKEVEDKEEVVGGEEGEEDEEEEGQGEEMEDSEATDDGEVSPRSPVVEEESSEVVKSGSASVGKRKRGRAPKAGTPVKASSRKTVGEDVCFICLDGGDLVLCDRRGCPKAYHPSCVDHDAEFFKSKGRWNCGWHLCNRCRKTAYFYCYTCTFSLCKGCRKDNPIFCVRGSKGFCESCLRTISMIESNEPDETGQSAFDDKSSWEYLFKDYWMEQKGKLSISSDELAKAEDLLKEYSLTIKQQTEVESNEPTNDAIIDSDNSLAKIDVTDSKRKRPTRKSKPVDSDTDDSSEKEVTPARRKSNRRSKSKAKESSSDSENSSEKKGKKVRRLSKSRLKATGLTSSNNVEWASEELMEFVMHMKNGDRSVLAPFDVQSLLLEYITRNKLRDPRKQSQILCDSMLQKLFGKPRVGHFEMLKLLEMHFLSKEDSHVNNNQGSIVNTEISELEGDDHTDLYMDSGKSRGKKSRKKGEDRGQSNLDDYAAIDIHNINLIYLRRCLMESLMDDSDTFHDKVVGCFVRIRISGTNQKQDIYRLVQIIGTSKAPEPYKVSKRTTDVMLEILNLDKTEIIAIDTISNQEFTEDECKRLRQSIKCGLISRMTVGDILDKARELQEVRVTNWLEAEVVRLGHLRDRASDLGRKRELRECVEKLQLLKTPEERQRRLEQLPEVHSDPKMDPSCESDEETESHDTPRRAANDTRSRESGFVRRGRDNFSSRHGGPVSNDSWSGNARPPNKTRELTRNSSSKGFSNRRDDNSSPSYTSEHGWGNGVDKGTPRSNSGEKSRIVQDTPVITRAEQTGARSDLSVSLPSESSQSLSSPIGQTDGKVNDTEKAWHYRDPTSKIQGPFSMSQLRKWSNTGYFPAELRIWRTKKTEDDSILLTEALAGRFQKEFRSDTTKLSGPRFDSSSLPSPTPSLNPVPLSGKQTSGSFQLTNQFQGNERLPSPTPTSPSNLSHQSKGDLIGNKQASQPGSGQFVSNSTPINAQQMASQQSVGHLTSQPFIRPDGTLNQTNVRPSGSGNGQGFSNAGQTNTGQNPAVYPQNWGAGFVARPEMMNTNPTPNNALPVQVAYNPWTGAPVNNQAQPFGAGYPPQGNVVANFPTMQVPSAWRPPTQTNMPWGAQQPPVNQNVGWAGPPMAQSTPGAQPMAAGPGTVGWMGSGPNPSATNTNMVWVGAPGTTGTWSGDQNRNGQGGQRNRQSSVGSGGQRVCKYFREHGNCRKGSSCDFKHT